MKKKDFEKAYTKEIARIKKASQKSGGDFYRTLGVRASKPFMRNLVASTLEGQTSFTEAFRLLGIRKMATFEKIGRQLEII